MNIHKHVQWSDAKKKFLGFITYGSKKKHNGIPVAKQALVFMVTAVNGDFSFPVAHFFIDSLVGMEKAYLIKEVLRSLTNVGIKVINLTFDGFPNNYPPWSFIQIDRFKTIFHKPI